jgi:hypothetical protein
MDIPEGKTRLAVVVVGWCVLASPHHGEQRVFEIATKAAKVRTHLPTECRKYYNDGTGRWIECMGVGLK